MRNKKLMLFSLTGNLLVFLSSLAGVLWYYLSLAPEAYGQGKTYFYYTINSNILVCLTSLLAIIL